MREIVSFWAENMPAMLEGLVVSLQICGVAIALGIPLGLALALGVQSKNPVVRWFALAVVEVGRGAPALLLLQFAYFGLPSIGVSLTSFLAASAALAWTTCAYTSEIIRAGLDAVPHGQREAATAIGFSGFDALRFVIIPQALFVAAPGLLGFAILLLQATSLCFAIALPELLSQAYMIGTNTFRYMAILSLAAILYGLVCIPATLAVSALERAIGRYVAS